jgi:hypothetical protein
MGWGSCVGPREALIDGSLCGDVVGSRPRKGSAAALAVRRSESDAGIGLTASHIEPIDQWFPRSGAV